MRDEPDGWAQQISFFVTQIDPLVRKVLDAEDAWDAYRAATDIADPILENESLPNAGGLYVAWRELEDVYETGRTPIPDAHAVLRQAASEWLERPNDAALQFFEDWRVRAAAAVGALFARDGSFWSDGQSSDLSFSFVVDDGGLVNVVLGEDLPILSEALSDSVSTRPPAGASQDGPSTYWIDRTLRHLDARLHDKSSEPFASGNITYLAVKDGVVEARFDYDSEDSEYVDTITTGEVRRLLLAWRAKTLEVSPGAADRLPPLKDAIPLPSGSGWTWSDAWILAAPQ